MSHWTDQKLDVLQQQAIQQLVTCELQLMAAKAVLSRIEEQIAIEYFCNDCEVTIGRGVCIFDFYISGPIRVVIEGLHSITYKDHIDIEFRSFTKKGKPCKQTQRLSFEYLKCFKKKPPATS